MKNICIGGQTPASAISLGCMRMWALDEKQTDAIIDCALENGINHFDHADCYGDGVCESMFGGYLKRHPGARAKMILQTRCASTTGYTISQRSIFSAQSREAFLVWELTA